MVSKAWIEFFKNWKNPDTDLGPVLDLFQMLLLSFWMMSPADLSSGTLSAFVFLFSDLDYRLSRLATDFQSVSYHLSRVERTLDFLKREPILVGGSVEVHPDDLQGSFHIRNVSFEYPARPGTDPEALVSNF